VIALRDWGRIIERPCYDLCILKDKFCYLEWQAIPCAFAYPAKRTWSRRTRQLIQFLTERREGWISMRDINEEANL